MPRRLLYGRRRGVLGKGSLAGVRDAAGHPDLVGPGDAGPVRQKPPGVEVVPPAVLVVQIVGVFPHVAAQQGLEVLGKLPINPELAAACDKGLIELYEGDWLDEAVKKLESL